ncbi:MAG: hypothetical protein K6B43_13840 [Treponema sp.]|nr:hypothetical protein [Treponema sp.]
MSARIYVAHENQKLVEDGTIVIDNVSEGFKPIKSIGRENRLKSNLNQEDL